MNDVSSSPASAPRRWPQFSLKTLMWLVLLAAAFLSGWSVAYRQAREAEALARREAEMARMAELEARDVAKKHALESLRLMAQGREKETAEDNVAKAIKAVLRLQADAWNAGDIERFMDHYWNSDDLTFSAGGQTTRGWQSTLDRYRQRYPTIEHMGRLTFDELEIQPLADSAALVLGRWRLARDCDAPSGNFSLIFRKIDGRWLIVHDHTSRAEPPADAPAGPSP
jgi:beta-aspartyl-peptidase (threonine type)